MKIFCEKCSAKISPILNFCFFCGSEAPRVTIPANLKADKFEEKVYCTKCKYECPINAFYCGSCGEYIYEKKESVFCPACVSNISSSASVCVKCGLNLDDFFSMKGDAIKKQAVSVDFILKEKMTKKNFVFFLKQEIKIGRHPSNDIVIPCEWVSSFHCVLDFKNMCLLDKESTNGTYANMKQEKITKVSLNTLTEFNIAGYFTFKVVQKTKVFSFFLRSILKEKEARKVGNGAGYDKLRKNSYIKFFGDDNIKIRHYDGFMFNEDVIKREYYKISSEDGFLYYSDEERKVNKILIMNENNILPKNWIFLNSRSK